MKTQMKIGLIALMIIGCGSTSDPRWTDDGSGSGNGDPNAAGDDGSGTNPNGTSNPKKPDPTNPDTPAPPIVSGLTISKIAVFQGVEVDVMKAGTWVATRNAPVVANRPALIRVYVTPDAKWASTTNVTAEIRLASGKKKFAIVNDSKTIKAASTDADPNSTFNLEVPGDSLPKDATFQINLTAAGATMPSGSSPGRYPNDGTAKSLGLETSGILRVVVVPVKYMADGSGRLPDTSAAQLDFYQKTMMARYPASDVKVTVRAPWSYSSSLTGSGSGINSLLNSATNLRKSDGADPDTYYYVAFAPTSSFASYCGGGCVTGLSGVVDDASISQLRVSVGIGYTGYESANTMAHEVGHAHGRNHAPCGGASGVDPQFPYAGAGIGVWGYHMFDKEFYAPTQAKDMMGYCSPEWVSDYTYSALFDRVSEVASLYPASATPPSATTTTQSYRIASVDADGNIEWIGGEEQLAHEPRGGQIRAATFSAAGQTLVTQNAHFYPYDHLPGGVLVVPSSPSPLASAWSHVSIAGIARPLAR